MTIPFGIPALLVLMSMYVPENETQQKKLEVVPSIDLKRYAGTWYEIARYPNRFQRECTGNVTATYTLLDDGTIRVINRCRQSNGGGAG